MSKDDSLVVYIGDLWYEVVVTHYLVTEGHSDPYKCDCPDDYYGTSELDFVVVNDDGQDITESLTKRELSRIEDELWRVL